MSGGLAKRGGGEYQKAAKAYKQECRDSGGANCYFCGKSIDFNLDYRDRWSFTVQHITPISRGGDIFARENMAPAHRRCNAQEGNRLAGTRTSDGDMTMGPKLKQSRVW